MRARAFCARSPFDFDWLFDWDIGAGPRTKSRRPGRGPGLRFFKQGQVRLALLSLIQEKAGHGYELMKRLEERSGGTYKASAGTVYPVLQQLEDEGLIKVQEEDGKKIYHLTDAGAEEMLLHEDAIDGIWKRATGWKDWGANMGPESAEIWGSWGRLTKAAFKAAARSDFEQTEKIREVLDKARKELEDL
jgi:DNA-binding PadR family transcriptional regulator